VQRSLRSQASDYSLAEAYALTEVAEADSIVKTTADEGVNE